MYLEYRWNKLASLYKKFLKLLCIDICFESISKKKNKEFGTKNYDVKIQDKVRKTERITWK